MQRSRARKRDRAGLITRDVAIGAVTGVAATLAMTLAADTLFRRLPRRERYPLPPRELTERVAEAAGVAEQLDEATLQAASLASHFGFGAAAGGLYAPLLLRRRMPPVLSGVAYALAVWTVSYLGWVPGLGLLRPATRHPRRRNALMLAVHLVWGATLGAAAGSLSRALAPVAGGPLRDR